MEVPEEMRDARVPLVRAAELANMHTTHFRRRIRQGIFPQPKRTKNLGKPFYDYELLRQVATVLRTGIGANGEEVMFYRRSAARRKQPDAPGNGTDDSYLADLATGLRQVGVPSDLAVPRRLTAVLTASYGDRRPRLEDAIPAVAARLLG